MNDLWSYDITSKQFTWQSGSTAAGSAGVYGTRGIAVHACVHLYSDTSLAWQSSGNVPGARENFAMAFDSSGSRYDSSRQPACFDSESDKGLDLWGLGLRRKSA